MALKSIDERTGDAIQLRRSYRQDHR
jgi:hypothetical protein